MVTIKKIAEVSGYSSSTVSRLLKNDTNLSITPETRKKILDTAIELGYQRTKIQTSLNKIGLFYWITENEELEDVYFKELRLAVKKYAQQNNLEVQLIKREQGLKKIPNDINGFVAIGPFSSAEIDILSVHCPKGVFLDTNPNPELFDSVQPDRIGITNRAIDYFIENGHKKIGFIGGTYTNPNTGDIEKDSREISFRNYLAQKNLLNESYIFGENHFSVKDGYEITQKALSLLKNDLPTAIFVASDPIAVGVLQALNEVGIIIPDEIEIISINNIDIAKYVSPPLSTFEIDLDEMGRTAISLLSDLIVTNRESRKSVFINSKLIVRKSFIPKLDK